MIRVGVYTSKIYDEGINPSYIHECCMTFVDGKLPEEETLKRYLARCKLRCSGCNGCQEAKK